MSFPKATAEQVKINFKEINLEIKADKLENPFYNNKYNNEVLISSSEKVQAIKNYKRKIKNRQFNGNN